MEITGKSRIIFVLADPVDHVRASAVLNEYFRSLNFDVAASPLHVAPGDLAQVVDAIRRMRNVAGFGVTIPHKVAVLPHLESITPRARLIGAVNFVKREADGRLYGDNLDAPGFMAGLERNNIPVQGRKVLQAGAGGAGRAVAFALADAGVAELRIVNRDEAKAHSLADAVAQHHPSVRLAVGPASAAEFDLVVNTTSLGMKPDDPLPIDVDGVGQASVVGDIIVNPPMTPLLRKAAAKGAKVLGGKAMLDEQMVLVARFMGLQGSME